MSLSSIKAIWNRRSLTALLAFALIFGLSIATFAYHGAEFAEVMVNTWQQAAVEPQLIDRINTMISGIESALQTHIYGRTEMIDLFGLYQLAMGRNSVEDSSDQIVLKDSRNNLHFLYYQQDIDYAVTNYVYFSTKLEELKIPHLYVQLPNKKIPGYTIMPLPLDNRSNETADSFLAQLEYYGLRYLDLRERLAESGIPYEDLFYRTDHHWQTRTAFWATTEIIGELEQREGWRFAEEPRDLANYDIVTYSQIFLGSQGKRVGRYYAGVDDFTVIYPHHPGSFTLYVNQKEWPTWQGTFRQTFLREEHLDPDLSVYAGRYATFLNYDMGLVHIVNHEMPEGKRLLVIKDSFTQALAPFLAQYVQELYLIDLRVFRDLNKPLLETIRDIAPDYLLVLYNTEAFNEMMFAFEWE